MAIGLHRVLSLPVTLPLPQLVEALNQFQPTYLHVYPSSPCGWPTSSRPAACGSRHGSWSPPRSCAPQR